MNRAMFHLFYNAALGRIIFCAETEFKKVVINNKKLLTLSDNQIY